jgi:hypothetical protein
VLTQYYAGFGKTSITRNNRNFDLVLVLSTLLDIGKGLIITTVSKAFRLQDQGEGQGQAPSWRWAKRSVHPFFPIHQSINSVAVLACVLANIKCRSVRKISFPRLRTATMDLRRKMHSCTNRKRHPHMLSTCILS